MPFNTVIGHDRQKAFLTRLLTQGNIPHAFLFSGPEGIGKKMLAKTFTQYLFCRSGSACGACPACVKLIRGTHPDLIVMESEGSIGIDDSRMIGKEVSEYPYESEKRIIIIDNAETMTREAANALLKTLEEPPPYNHFFLITSVEKGIPATIRSRCTRIFFSALSRELLKSFFALTQGMDNERAGLLADISYGSAHCGLFWAEDTNFQLRRAIVELITRKQPDFVTASYISEKISRIQGGYEIFLGFLLSFLRDLTVFKRSPDTKQIVNADLYEFLQWPKADEVWLAEAMKRLQETLFIIRYNINKALCFENLLFQMMR